jgi:hypothetical protein
MRLIPALPFLVLILSTGLASAASFSSELTAADFLNQGYVASGETLEIDHVFEPSLAVESVNFVYLSVTVTDDFNCSSFGGCVGDWLWMSETAGITLNDTSWKQGDATMHTFWGDVTELANLSEAGNVLGIDVISLAGDFQVWSTTMWVDFDVAEETGGGGSNIPTATGVMPEPSAALVFLVGGLMVSSEVRRQGRSRSRLEKN